MGYDSEAHSVLQTADGGYVAAGISDSFFHYFKTDSVGGTLWSNLFSIGCANSIQHTPDGGFILAGHTGNGLFGEADICLVRCDSAGNLFGIWECGGLADDIGNSVDTTADDCFIITGYTESFGAGGRDVYLINTASDAGVEGNESAVVTNKEITTTIFRGPPQLPREKNAKSFTLWKGYRT